MLVVIVIYNEIEFNIMKTKLLFLILLCQVLSSNGQSIEINQITPTAVSGGINVNLLVTTYNGAGYLNHSYTVIGNTINLSVCYWFNSLQPVYQMSNDFLISTPNNIDYNINVNIINSSSQTVCDNYSTGPNSTTNFLKNEEFDNLINKYSIYPNPSKGEIELIGDGSLVKSLNIYDNLGRLIKQVNERITEKIDLYDLKDGIYFVLIKTEDGILNQKLVIKK